MTNRRLIPLVSTALLVVVGMLAPAPLHAQGPPSAVEYYHLDALGSVRVVTNQAGAVVSRHDLMPFGEEWQPVTLGREALLFTGKERDSDTGLDYFGARYLKADLGRFLSPDPLLNSGQPWNPQTWNRYAYTLNNPIRYTDPLGLYVWGDCSGDSDKCSAAQQRFRNSIAKAQEALKNFDPNSKEAKELKKTLDKLGEEGKGNIRINFGDAGTSDGAPNLGWTVGNSITVNYDAVDSVKSAHDLNGSEAAALDAGLTAHEGTHAGKGPIWGFIGMRGEHAAHFAESVTYQGLHITDRPSRLWNEGWLKVDRYLLEQKRERAIQEAIHPPKQPAQK